LQIKRLNPAAAPQGQGGLFTVYRYHAVGPCRVEELCPAPLPAQEDGTYVAGQMTLSGPQRTHQEAQ
jgi:hypothetical protein